MRLVLLHALPFDSRMWDSNLDEIVEDLVTPSLYNLVTQSRNGPSPCSISVATTN
jgi:hypothetical protein